MQDRVPTSPGGSGSVLPGGNTRRPSINSIHPFKSATVSSSPSSHHSLASFRQHSPLSAAMPGQSTSGAVAPPTAKRYSSSFTHRHTHSAASASGGDGAGGAGSSVGSGAGVVRPTVALGSAGSGGDGLLPSPFGSGGKRTTSDGVCFYLCQIASELLMMC